MPAFLITIVLFCAFLWFATVRLLLNTTPNTFFSIFLFLGVLFLNLAFTFSIPTYFFLINRSSNLVKLRHIYRKSLKWGFYFSFGICGFLGLRAFELINLLNLGLFVVLYLLLFLQLKSRR